MIGQSVQIVALYQFNGLCPNPLVGNYPVDLVNKKVKDKIRLQFDIFLLYFCLSLYDEIVLRVHVPFEPNVIR